MKIKVANIGCIEIGCGNGFWGKVVLNEGTQWYKGLDISKTAVKQCREAVPDGSFECVNLSEEDYIPEEQADLVFSIDVIQHIVEEVKLKRFLSNMVACTRPGGHIVLTAYTGYGDGYTDKEEKEVLLKFIRIPKLRWVYAWDTPTIQRFLLNCNFLVSSSFWDKTILAFVRQ